MRTLGRFPSIVAAKVAIRIITISVSARPGVGLGETGVVIGASWVPLVNRAEVITTGSITLYV